MKEFGIDEIVDEIYVELGLTGPKKHYHKLIRDHFRFIMKVMRSKRDRIMMRECDLHTIYTNPDINEMCGLVADVDETRVQKFPKGFFINNGHVRFRGQKRRGVMIAISRAENIPKLHG